MFRSFRYRSMSTRRAEGRAAEDRGTGRPRRRRRRLAATLLSVLLVAASASAQQDAALTLNLEAYRLVVGTSDDGPTEALEPALMARPGDVLEWRLEARSVGVDPVPDVTLDIPVPPDTVYVDGSARSASRIPDEATTELPGDAFLFSVDGGVTFAHAPLVREVVTVVDGDEVVREEPVPPSAITHVRYPLDEVLPDVRYLVTIRTEVPR